MLTKIIKQLFVSKRDMMTTSSVQHDAEFSVDFKKLNYAENNVTKNHFPWPFWLVATLAFLLLLIYVADRIFDPNNFPITSIDIQGEATYVDQQSVQQQVSALVAGNYFSIDLDLLEARVENLPWVQDAAVRRQWPDTVVVSFIEMRPVAKWGDQEWLGFDGSILNHDEFSSDETNNSLPVLYSEGDSRPIWKAYKSWFPLFSEAGFVVSRLVRDEQNIWNAEIRLNALAVTRNQQYADALKQQNIAVTLIFNDEHAYSRLQRFSNVFGEHLLEHFHLVETIDLRYPHGFAIGWKQSVLNSTGFDPKSLFFNKRQPEQ